MKTMFSSELILYISLVPIDIICALQAKNYSIYAFAQTPIVYTNYVPGEDSDQPGHTPSLIRVFALRPVGSSGPRGQRRLYGQTWRMSRLISVFARRTCHFVGFVN